MNNLTVLNPVFDRHGITRRMRKAVVRSFTIYPPRASDIPTFRRFKTDVGLRKLIRECRIAAGIELRNTVYGTSR